MNQEYWKFWKKSEEERAGGNELERSESSFPPATPPTEEGLAESRDESMVIGRRGCRGVRSAIFRGLIDAPSANDAPKG